MSRACLAILAAGVVLLSGCGDDKPYGGPDPNQGSRYSPPAPTPVAESPAPAPTPDPLLSGSSTIPTADPLLSQDKGTQGDPLIGSDPLQGRTMPTEHSHWLRGRVLNARLTVLLNGVREGDYAGFVDKDITMKLRHGINTVSFLYTPRQTDSSAQMDLLESEHDPPIAPLASFQSLPQMVGAAGVKTAAQRITFYAK